jgi:hypothetical protein
MGEAKEAEALTQKAPARRAAAPTVEALRNLLGPRGARRAGRRCALGTATKRKARRRAASGRAWSGNCTCVCAYTAVLFAAGKKGLKEK